MPEPRLRLLTESPLNAETPLPALRTEVTPVELAFVRNHFSVPEGDPSKWMLEVCGAVQNPVSISLRDIQAFTAKTLLVILECAGNARTSVSPVPKGVPWGHGAVSVVRLTGTPVRSLLEKAGLSKEAVEVGFVGADRGEVEPGRVEHFARSLPLDVAMSSDALLAWEMDGQPLPVNHGFPLRLIVPGLYAMASVKWLKEIRVLTTPYTGFFQGQNYVYLDENGTKQGEPVGRMRVRSLIVEPSDGATLRKGEIEVSGMAWSGHGSVVEVAVGTNGSKQWLTADLDPAASPYGVQRWRVIWKPQTEGAHMLACRATDSRGNIQPTTQRWNRLGYGNNGPHAIGVNIV